MEHLNFFTSDSSPESPPPKRSATPPSTSAAGGAGGSGGIAAQLQKKAAATRYTFAGGSADQKHHSPPPFDPEVVARVKVMKPLSEDRIPELVMPLAAQLKDLSCFDIMGTSTQSVVIEAASPLPVAFTAALESRVSSVVIWDATVGAFTGLLTITDYIKILLAISNGQISVEDARKMTVAECRASSVIGGEGKPLVAAFIDDSVLACLEAMRSARINRIPVLAGRQAPGGDGADVANLAFVLTYLQIFAHLGNKLLTAVPSESMPPMTADIGAYMMEPTDTPDLELNFNSLFDVYVGLLQGLGKNYSTPVHVTMDTTLREALQLLVTAKVHVVPIVNPDTMTIVDTLSRSDVMKLEVGGGYDLNMTIRDALSGRVAGNIFVFTAYDSLRDVVALLVRSGVRAVFRVDEDNVLCGQLSCVDILQYIATHVEPPRSPTQ